MELFSHDPTFHPAGLNPHLPSSVEHTEDQNSNFDPSETALLLKTANCLKNIKEDFQNISHISKESLLELRMDLNFDAVNSIASILEKKGGKGSILEAIANKLRSHHNEGGDLHSFVATLTLEELNHLLGALLELKTSLEMEKNRFKKEEHKETRRDEVIQRGESQHNTEAAEKSDQIEKNVIEEEERLAKKKAEERKLLNKEDLKSNKMAFNAAEVENKNKIHQQKIQRIRSLLEVLKVLLFQKQDAKLSRQEYAADVYIKAQSNLRKSFESAPASLTTHKISLKSS